jgi:O-antigen ligase
MMHIKNFSYSAILVIFLLLFILINPFTNLDILAFLVAGFIILQKILGEYFILVLLALRPAMDYWRDYNLFSVRVFNFNINAALSVFLLIWTILFVAQNYQYIKKLPLTDIWTAFILWCSISAFYTYSVSATVIETLKLSNLFGLFAITYIMSQKNPQAFKKYFLASAIGAAVIPFAVGAYQFITKTGMDIDDVANRIFGTFAHPNVLATFALTLLLLAVSELVSRTSIHGFKKMDFFNLNQEPKIKLVIFALVCVIALTYTRIAWIGAAILGCFIGAMYYRKLLLYACIAVALFYGLFYPVNRYLINNFNVNLQANTLIARLTSRNQDADSVRWRTNLAAKIIPLFKEHWLVGYGYGTFSRVWDDNKDIENLWDNTSEAHNDYIKVAFESGVIGLILFIFIFIILLYQQIVFGLKNNWLNIIFIASIFIYLTLSISDNMLRHTPVIWWLWAIWGYWISQQKTIRESYLNK